MPSLAHGVENGSYKERALEQVRGLFMAEQAFDYVGRLLDVERVAFAIQAE